TTSSALLQYDKCKNEHYRSRGGMVTLLQAERMARERMLTGGQGGGDGDNNPERQRDDALRPRRLSEVNGQKAVVDRLQIAINACKKLKEPLGHMLFDGPPGLGKTTFATVLPNELGASIQITSGPALAKPADLLPYLTNAKDGSFIFIDEIHR